MPTKLYLRWGGLGYARKGFGFPESPGIWDPSVSNGFVDGAGVPGELRTTAGTNDPGTVLADRNSVAGPTSGICGNVWATYPLTSSFTLSGTVTFVIWAAESAEVANMTITCALYRLRGLVLTEIVAPTAFGSELGITLASRTWTASPTPVVFQPGDRLLLFHGFDDAGGNMASAQYGRITFESQDGSNGGSYVQITETGMTFDETLTTPAGSKLYLLDTLSDVDVGVDEREMWTDPGSATATAIVNVGTTPSAPGQWTKAAGGTAIEWYSRLLNAVTISGPMRIRCWDGISINDQRCYRHAVVHAVDGNGANPVLIGASSVWGLPTLSDAHAGYMDQYGTERQVDSVFGASGVSIPTGGRIRLRLYVGDYWWNDGGGSRNGGRVCTVRYNGSTDANQTFLQFTETLSEYTPPEPPEPPVPPDPPYLIPIARIY